MYKTNRPKETIKKIEERLQRYAILKERINYSKSDIDELHHRAAFQTGQEEKRKLNEQIQSIKASVALDEYEVRQIERALSFIRDDMYYMIIDCKYFKDMTDYEAADVVMCSLSTLRRQKRKLLCKIADALYGMG